MFGFSIRFGPPSFSSFGEQSAFGQTNTANANNRFSQTHFGSARPFSSQTRLSFFGGTAINDVFDSIERPSSTPPFATSSRPAFGTSSVSAFGSTSRAQFTIPTFGCAGFGRTPFWRQHGGSRAVPYTKTNEADGCVRGQAPGKLISISAMPQYKEKSHDELRWEHYQLGDKGGPNPGSQQPTGPSPFSQSAQSSPFGQATSTFGQTSAFGQSSVANPFCSLSSIFGNKSSPFGGAAFGTSFGSAFSTPFGISSSTSHFGAQSRTPTFGSTSFGQTPFGGQHGGAVPYTSTNEADDGVGGESLGELISISAMPQFREKSHEELRWEDYQLDDYHAFFTSSRPAFGSTSGASTQAIGASSTTPFFGFGSISENPYLRGVDTGLERWDMVTAERDRLRLELEALRVERDRVMVERDGLRTQLKAVRDGQMKFVAASLFATLALVVLMMK